MTNVRAGFRRCDIMPIQEIAGHREFFEGSHADVPLIRLRFEDREAVLAHAAFQIARPRIMIITGSSFHAMRQVLRVKVDTERMLDHESHKTQAEAAGDRKR